MRAETIPALLAERAARSPDLAAIVSGPDCVSYAELDRRSAARAACLVARGVGRTHRVGLFQQDGADWAVNAHAVMRIGAVLVPLDAALDLDELQARLAVAALRHVIVAPSSGSSAEGGACGLVDRASLPTLRNILMANELNNDPGNTAQAVAAALESRVLRADDMVVLFGEDGEAVIHTHGAAIRATRAAVEAYGPAPGALHPVAAPLSRLGGFGAGLVAALVAGGTLLIEAQADSERTGSSAGMPIAPESFGPYCGVPFGKDIPSDKQGSAGRVLQGFTLRVRDPGSQKIAPPGATGAIEIGGPNLLRGVCGLEREQIFTADGWVATGDTGSVDADGFVWLAAGRERQRRGRSTVP